MQAPQPPARTGPRPLPLHLAIEAWISQLSFSGLMLSKSVSRPSSLNQLPLLPDLLPKALAESQSPPVDGPFPVTSLDPVRLIDELTRTAKDRLATFAQGVTRYQTHTAYRHLAAPDAVWLHGAATLRDYGGTGPAVLVVPSLINRSTILDLAPDRSLLRTMAAAGLHTFLLDWGCPGAAERTFTVDDYVSRVLIPAVKEVARRTKMPVRLVGYCMGGTLATAPAVLVPEHVAALAVVAAPWDFHAGTEGFRALLTMARPAMEALITQTGEAPFDLIQTLFACLDPTMVGHKFRRFAKIDPQSEDARRFVILEDWLNDPVPLVAGAARECLFTWYLENTPARGLWRVNGTAIDPARVQCRSLALIPSRDRIVPPASAQALARALPDAQIHTVPLGHIGMIAGGRAVDTTYRPLIAWLEGAPNISKA